MHVLEHLKETLEDEIKNINKKGTMTIADLDMAYKAVDIIKDIETIEAMNAYEEEEPYSRNEKRTYHNYAHEYKYK